jgi:hypothetical protein
MEFTKTNALIGYRDDHTRIAKRLMPKGAFYMLDLLAVAALKRSMAFLAAFRLLIEQKNFIGAAPFVRMQLDNLLRLSAAHRSSDPNQLSLNVLEGKQINNLTDRDGNRMTDSYLVRRLSEKHSWVSTVYKQASGYVHLSDKHILSTAKLGTEVGAISMHITDVDADISEPLYDEAIEAFKSATDLLFEYINGLVVWKQNHAEADTASQT